MTSPARIEANRKNAQKSTGPKTIEGKKRSCLNALDHGLRSEQVVLPTEDQSAFDAHLAAFVQDWQPTTVTRLHLVKRAAVATWRLDRCVRVESGRLSNRIHHALNNWDMIRAAATKRSVARLDTDPERATRELRSTREGVAQLVEIWREIEEAATTPGAWVDLKEHHCKYFQLQGVQPVDVSTDNDLLLRFLLIARPDLIEESELEPLSDNDAEKVRSHILNRATTHINLLIDLWPTLPDESEARARHAEIEAFAPQPEDAALLRYEAQFDREFRASINQLARLSKTGDDLIEIAPNEPIIEATPEPVAPNEPKPEPVESTPEPAAPNEPNTIAPVMPIPQAERDRDNRLWPAVSAPEGSDEPQSIGWNR
jgi:hypothetical protein